jgi:hypothetical protein
MDGNQFVYTKKFVFNLGWQAANYVGRRERAHLITAATATPSLLLLGSKVGSIGPNQLEFDRTFNGVNMEWMGRIGDTSYERPHGLWATGSAAEMVYRGTNNSLYLTSVNLPVN